MSLLRDLPTHRRPRRPRLPGARATALVVIAGVLLGVGLSAAGAAAWGHRERTAQRIEFRAAADGVGSTLKTMLARDDDYLAALATAMRLDPAISPGEFSEWYHGLSGSARVVGLGTAVVRIVPPNQLAAFQRRRDADPTLSSALGVDPQPVDAVPGVRYCMLADFVAVGSLAGYGPLLRGNWCGATLIGAYEATHLAFAERTGDLSVIPPRPPLLDDTILQLPIYRRGAPTTTVAQRRRAVAGWVLSSFDLQSLAAAAVGDDGGLSVSLIYRGAAATPEQVASAGHAAGHAVVRENFTVAGPWTAVVRGASTDRGMSPGAQEAIAFAVGVTISFLLGLLVLTLARSRARALRIVAEQTGQLRHQALHDALTDLPNRVLALQRITGALESARRSGTFAGLLYIDVDGFKQINDTFGHAAGDRFLTAVAERLRDGHRADDAAARLAGDEFVIVLEPTTPELALQAAERLRQSLSAPYDLGAEAGRMVSVSVSIGVACGRDQDPDELLADADAALYAAKSAGRNRCVTFEPELHLAAQQRAALELDLASALQEQQLSLVYQPILLHGTHTTGVEALLRWEHPTRGPISPAEFIPIAERSGLIVEIGRWVLQTACDQGARWQLRTQPLTVAVNVSGRQLDEVTFVDEVREALTRSGLKPQHLVLEVTETAMMRDARVAAGRLQALRELGVQVAIDDFGAGYSSLAHLRELPVDVLKIDRAFIHGIERSPRQTAMVQTLISLGKALGLAVVAEGVETEAELSTLRETGCELAQGFLFARPVGPDQLNEFLSEDRGGEALPSRSAAGTT